MYFKAKLMLKGVGHRGYHFHLEFAHNLGIARIKSEF